MKIWFNRYILSDILWQIYLTDVFCFFDISSLADILWQIYLSDVFCFLTDLVWQIYILTDTIWQTYIDQYIQTYSAIIILIYGLNGLTRNQWSINQSINQSNCLSIYLPVTMWFHTSSFTGRVSVRLRTTSCGIFSQTFEMKNLGNM